MTTLSFADVSRGVRRRSSPGRSARFELAAVLLCAVALLTACQANQEAVSADAGRPVTAWVNNPPGLNVRTLPTASNSQVIGILAHGTQVEVLAWRPSPNDSSFTYYNVRTSEGLTGWVYAGDDDDWLTDEAPARTPASVASPPPTVEVSPPPPAGPCSAQETDEVVGHLGTLIAANSTGDVFGMIDTWLDLEQRVSTGCWRAVNRHADPRVVDACSGAELDHLASFTGPSLRATREILVSFDFAPLSEISATMQASLSPRCVNTITTVQQLAQQTPGGVSGTIPSVLDHGGGTYSVPGVVSCGPSGCIGN